MQSRHAGRLTSLRDFPLQAPLSNVRSLFSRNFHALTLDTGASFMQYVPHAVFKTQFMRQHCTPLRRLVTCKFTCYSEGWLAVERFSHRKRSLLYFVNPPVVSPSRP